MVVDFLVRNPGWVSKLSGRFWAEVRSTRVRVIAIADGDTDYPAESDYHSKLHPDKCLYDPDTGKLLTAAAPAPLQDLFDQICELQKGDSLRMRQPNPYVWKGYPFPVPVSFDENFEDEMWSWTGGVDTNCPPIWYTGHKNDMYRPPRPVPVSHMDGCGVVVGDFSSSSSNTGTEGSSTITSTESGSSGSVSTPTEVSSPVTDQVRPVSTMIKSMF